MLAQLGPFGTISDHLVRKKVFNNRPICAIFWLYSDPYWVRKGPKVARYTNGNVRTAAPQDKTLVSGGNCDQGKVSNITQCLKLFKLKVNSFCHKL